MNRNLLVTQARKGAVSRSQSLCEVDGSQEGTSHLHVSFCMISMKILDL